jgi:hypothetical protein
MILGTNLPCLSSHSSLFFLLFFLFIFYTTPFSFSPLFAGSRGCFHTSLPSTPAPTLTEMRSLPQQQQQQQQPQDESRRDRRDTELYQAQQRLLGAVARTHGPQHSGRGIKKEKKRKKKKKEKEKGRKKERKEKKERKKRKEKKGKEKRMLQELADDSDPGSKRASAGDCGDADECCRVGGTLALVALVRSRIPILHGPQRGCGEPGSASMAGRTFGCHCG